MSVERSELGKIETIRVGLVNDDREFGAWFALSGPGFGVQTSIAFPWRKPERGVGTSDTQKIGLGEVCLRLVELMQEAKVNDITKLRGTPVSMVVKDNVLQSWRILTEVL